MDYSVKDLTTVYNFLTGKTIQVGSYAKSKLLARLKEIPEAAGFLAGQISCHDLVNPGDGLEEMAAMMDGALDEMETPAVPATAPVSDDEWDQPAPAVAGSPEKDVPTCPACGATDGLVPAGKEGSLYHEIGLLCQCGKAWHVLTGEDLVVAGEPTKKKRVILNPQPKIDAKVRRLAEDNYSIDYDKNERTWSIARFDGEGDVITMTSREFASYTPDGLAELALKELGKSTAED